MRTVRWMAAVALAAAAWPAAAGAGSIRGTVDGSYQDLVTTAVNDAAAAASNGSAGVGGAVGTLSSSPSSDPLFLPVSYTQLPPITVPASGDWSSMDMGNASPAVTLATALSNALAAAVRNILAAPPTVGSDGSRPGYIAVVVAALIPLKYDTPGTPTGGGSGPSDPSDPPPIAAVPEPAGVALAASGLAALAVARALRRRRNG